MQIYANNHIEKAILKRDKTDLLEFIFSWLWVMNLQIKGLKATLICFVMCDL